MSVIRIRCARPGEGRVLSRLALRSKAHWGYSREFMGACEAELAVAEQAIVDGAVFVLDDRGEALGFYSLERLDLLRAELGHLIVEPARIRQGHGRELLAHAVGVARSRGFAA